MKIANTPKTEMCFSPNSAVEQTESGRYRSDLLECRTYRFIYVAARHMRQFHSQGRGGNFSRVTNVTEM